jgi:hypothetical protein
MSVNTGFPFLDQNILIYAGALVGIGACLLGIVYMLSKFFENKRMEAWAKTEAAYMMVPFLLLLILSIISPLLAPMVQDIDPIRYNALCDGKVVDGSKCHLVVGEAYLRSIFSESLDIEQNVLRLSFYFSIAKSMFSTSGSGIFAAAGVKITNSLVYAFTVPALGLLNFVSRLVTTTMVISGGFLVLYRLVFSFVPLVTLGFLLRIIPATRMLGGLLIAVALASYFFLPMMLCVADSIYLNIPPAPNNNLDGREYRLSRFVPVNIDVYDFGGGKNDISMLFREKSAGNPLSDAMAQMDTVRNDITQGINSNSQLGGLSSRDLLTNPSSKSAVGEVLDSMLNDVTKTFSLHTAQMLVQMLEGAYTSAVLAAGIIFPNTAQGALSITMSSYDGSTITSTHISPLLFIFVDELTNVWIFSGLVLYIAAITLVGVIKTLSPLLGGDVEIAGLSRLI